MKKLALFAALLKINEEARTVTGVIADETRDLTNEVFDYATSKAHFEAWSGGIAKATDGKSVGNVRAMHGNVVAGRLQELLADDATKSITVTAHIVDDVEWNKVTTGCYTGFSIGGKYDKKWQDPNDSTAKRYTAIPSEVSLVDLPCNPSAQFTVIKAEGAEELRKFVTPEEREVLIVDEFTKVDSLDAIKALVTKHADTLVVKVEQVTDPIPGQAERLFAKAAEAEPIANALSLMLGREPLEKGLWTVSSFCDILASLASLTANVKSEADYEGDNSPIPGKLSAATTALGAIFLEMAAEEIDEANAQHNAVLALAAQGDLNKSLSTSLEQVTEQLAKAAGDLQKMTAERDTAVSELATYKASTPAPSKGVVVAKTGDNASPLEDKADELRKQIEAMPEGPDKVRALIKLAHQNPV